MPPALISSSRSVAGRAADGTHRSRIERWKNKAIACWTVVIVLPAVRSSPNSAPRNRPSHSGSAAGWVRRISSGCGYSRGLETHSSTSSSPAPLIAAAWK